VALVAGPAKRTSARESPASEIFSTAGEG
jgi:hypothetical protein